MNGEEQRLASEVKRHLDRGLEDLRPGIAYRLQQARARAVARMGEAAETAGDGELTGAFGLASAGGPGFPQGYRAGRPFIASKRFWLGLVMAVAAFVAYQQWSTWQEEQAIEDLDMQILSSDLPIDAYLDRGFQVWLKTPTADQ